jgi:hypothetical protein
MCLGTKLKASAEGRNSDLRPDDGILQAGNALFQRKSRSAVSPRVTPRAGDRWDPNSHQGKLRSDAVQNVFVTAQVMTSGCCT